LKDKHQPLTGLNRYAPRYWPGWLGVGLMRLLIRLPYRMQLAVGRLLGRLFRRFSPYRRTIAMTNLELCFPDLTVRERELLLGRFWESLGMSLVETAAGLWAPDRFFRPLGSIEGLHHLEAARRDGRGVLLLSGHFCSLDFAGRILVNHYPACFTYQELRNRLLDQLTRKARQANCRLLIHRHDIRGFIKALRAGEVVWYAPDQDQGRKNSVFVPLFGVPANTLDATTKLARLTGAAVMPFIIQRLPDARGYKLTIEAALENFPGVDELEDAARFNALIESQIRAHPEQYLWIHRRFKSRPPGFEKVYPPKPRRAKRRQRLLKQAARRSADREKPD
jgi:KDO2-lipid IV(A) lauroyltransferase